MPATRRCLAVLTLAVAGLALPAAARADAPRLTHGTAAGDVTADSAVVWARADRPAVLHVTLRGRERTVAVDASTDFTGQVRLDGLRPGAHHAYRVWATAAGERSRASRGSFRTAPASHKPAAVRLAFGGDVAGQNVCRDAAEGFPIMRTISDWRPDVFVGLGDMVYADNACDPVGRYGNAQVAGDFGPATDLESFRAHWRYNRTDAGLQALLARTGYVGVWDDHEVVNDFGPSEPLLPTGRQAFLEYTPIAAAPRLYRSIRWGRHLELFVLDTRSYREPNAAPDGAEHPKTMLGAAQLAWLKAAVATSDATWKVVVSSVPMSIPTGFPAANGRDGWANFDQDTGFERELLDILASMHGAGVRNTVWITTDVHFAEAFRYTPFDGFDVHELISGPLSAGIFPIATFDDTLAPERLTLYAPESPGAVTSWEEAKRWLNFGTLEARRDGSLTMSIVTANGDVPFARTLQPR
jgi:alkaline phosphatase D